MIHQECDVKQSAIMVKYGFTRCISG